MKKKKKIRIKKMRILLLLIIAILSITVLLIGRQDKVKLTKAMETVNTYMSYIGEAKYSEMYQMLSDSAKGNITEEKFISLNEEMYGKLEANNVRLTDMAEEEENRENKSNLYESYGNTCRNIKFCKYSKADKTRSENIKLIGQQI